MLMEIKGLEGNSSEASIPQHRVSVPYKVVFMFFRLPESTFSLWGYMWQHISNYANPLYKGGETELLWPDTAPQTLK